MSTMHARAVLGTANLEDEECGQSYCDRSTGVELVEAAGELRRLCRICRKDFWRVSS